MPSAWVTSGGNYLISLSLNLKKYEIMGTAVLTLLGENEDYIYINLLALGLLGSRYFITFLSLHILILAWNY